MTTWASSRLVPRRSVCSSVQGEGRMDEMKTFDEAEQVGFVENAPGLGR